MLVIFLRTLITFIILMVIMRLMGKRQIGEMQPFEFIVTLIIADLACVPMQDVSTPLIYGIVAIVALFILHQLLSLLEQSGAFAKKVLSGSPSIVIDKKGVIMKELKKNNMGLNDLIEAMRAQGYFSLDQLDYAIFESNGKLSCLESPTKVENSIPILIIDDGKIVNENLEVLERDKNDICSFVQEQGENVNSAEVMTIDGNGRVYFKAKGKPFKILDFNLKENTKW